MNYGFVRVGVATPELKVADCKYNAEKIIEMMRDSEDKNIKIVAFPEMSITSYTCGDLFHQDVMLDEAEKQLLRILEATKNTDIIALLGMPLRVDSQLFNCAVVIQKGRILGAVPKIYIPNYSEFYEGRWFSSGLKLKSSSVKICGYDVPIGTDLLFEAENFPGLCFGIEICEDLWVPVPPSSMQAMAGAVLLFNLSASNEVIGKHEYRRELVRQQSARCTAGYIYSSSGIGESTTDLVFGGYGIIAEYGTVLAETERFNEKGTIIYSDIDIFKLLNDRRKNTSFMECPYKSEVRKIIFNINENFDYNIKRYVDPHPFVPANRESRDLRCREIFAIQTAGLRKRILHTNLKKAVIAISGGLDSTLALLVTVNTFDKLNIPRDNILAITMPGFGTTGETYNNAMQLMKSLKVNYSEIDIKPVCLKHFEDIGHDAGVHDVTYENVQARERCQILMDIANKVGGLVIGTGDLSELALGWCTYNGDHMSMYSVNCSIPKTLVKFLVEWVAENVADNDTREVLYRILETPISPELLPPDPDGRIQQKTEDIVGPYELHDFFLYHMVRYGASPSKILFLAQHAFKGAYDKTTIEKWLKVFCRRFFSQQFKRSCLPDGPKVGTISLSPRGDWRMPSDAEAAVWLGDIE